MFPANAFTIRLAGDQDAAALRRLAELDSRRELAGRVLIAIHDEVPIAALSIDEGRTVADPFRRTSIALTLLRMRASALTSYERTPSLRERIRAGTRVAHGPLAHAEA
jgi:putative ubiquitin-RnfH superfamily antitoxin RatB of RatAB toxin-antitoxin module